MTIKKGETANLVINYQFDVANLYAGYQFELKLPEGISTVRNSSSVSEFTAGETHDNTFIISNSYDAESGCVIFVALSFQSHVLTGCEGILLTIPVNVSDDVSVGSVLNGSLENIQLSKEDGSTTVYLSNQNFTITITDSASDWQPATITANNLTMVYGDNVPVLTYTVEGGELGGIPELQTSAEKTSSVNTYDIVVSQGSVQNPNVTYVNGTLTITKAPLTINGGSYTMKQGETLPEFNASYVGWKNNETESVLTKKPTMTTTATSQSEPGTYDVVVSGAEAQNYAITYVNGILTIEENSTGIAEISVSHPADVYTTQGQKVRTQATDLKGLPSGIYIVNGHKIQVK